MVRGQQLPQADVSPVDRPEQSTEESQSHQHQVSDNSETLHWRVVTDVVLQLSGSVSLPFTMSGEGINPGLAATQANIAQELMEEDLKRELERNQLATKMAMAKEQEAQEAKVRSVF